MKSNDKPKILFISFAQYGYHSDPYYYSKYLSEYYNVQFISGDFGYNTVNQVFVNDVYVIKKPKINKLFRFYFFTQVIGYLFSNSASVIMIFRFPFCFLLPVLFPKRNFIYDIRSGGVSKSFLKRKRIDLSIKFNTLFYKNVTVISESLAERLKIRERNITILPVGSEVISQKSNPDKNLFNLVYVGTLDNRNIEETIYGVASFCSQYNFEKKIFFNIVGFGKPETIEKINRIISDLNMKENIILHGRKNHSELGDLFSISNIGVSFVPITDYYHVQPPTKTFEYLLSGIPVLATKTNEQCKVIDSANGYLIDDNRTSFAKGLSSMVSNYEKYNSEEIRNNAMKFHWKNIVNTSLKPLIEKIL